MQKIIEIKNAVPIHKDFRIAQPMNFCICHGERITLWGNNGSGKTKLVNMLTNNFPLCEGQAEYHFDTTKEEIYNNIKSVIFQDVSGGASPDYYQQRYNRGDLAESYATVCTLFDKFATFNEQGNKTFSPEQKNLIQRLGLEKIWNEPLIFLSSGELRKVQIGKHLMHMPKVLIIDNPYIGLDKAARFMLNEIFAGLPEEIALIFVVCRQEDIPICTTHLIHIEGGKIGEKKKTNDIQTSHPKKAQTTLTNHEEDLLTQLAENESPIEAKTIIRFHDINVRYNQRNILSHIDWEVKQGEHWLLSGGNGSGKSTLLSLVMADNPMAYACDIQLFGKQRGKGESIWDIKRNIGYVSPELHRSYRHDLPAIDIVASGIFDTVGLYRKATEKDKQKCRQWMKLFRCENLAERSYMSLSSGEQRLILLVRAFVKSPALLVLDEPFHGLDAANRQYAGEIINRYAQMKGKTLIMVTHYREELPPCILCEKTLTKS